MKRDSNSQSVVDLASQSNALAIELGNVWLMTRDG